MTLSAGLLVWGFVQGTVRAVHVDLCAATTSAATSFAVGATAHVPARAAALATHMLRGFLWQKVRAAAMLVLLAGMLGVGAALWLDVPADGLPPPLHAVAVADEPAPKPAARPKLREASTAAA